MIELGRLSVFQDIDHTKTVVVRQGTRYVGPSQAQVSVR